MFWACPSNEFWRRCLSSPSNYNLTTVQSRTSYTPKERGPSAVLIISTTSVNISVTSLQSQPAWCLSSLKTNPKTRLTRKARQTLYLSFFGKGTQRAPFSISCNPVRAIHLKHNQGILETPSHKAIKSIYRQTITNSLYYRSSYLSKNKIKIDCTQWYVGTIHHQPKSFAF